MTRKPKLWNRHDANVPFGAVYIGRPSKWGNPFFIGPDSRSDVIRKYKKWLKAQKEIGCLDVQELRGKDLVCWCTPLPCHGDVLLAEANK